MRLQPLQIYAFTTLALENLLYTTSDGGRLKRSSDNPPSNVTNSTDEIYNGATGTVVRSVLVLTGRCDLCAFHVNWWRGSLGRIGSYGFFSIEHEDPITPTSGILTPNLKFTIIRIRSEFRELEAIMANRIG
jgi:hypothetical protein